MKRKSTIYGIPSSRATRGQERTHGDQRTWWRKLRIADRRKNLQPGLCALNITRTPFDELNGNIQGFAYRREIAVNPVAGLPHNQAAVPSHEVLTSLKVAVGAFAEWTAAKRERPIER